MEDMTKNVYARPVIPLLVSFMAGIAMGFYIPGQDVGAWVLIAGSAGGLGFTLARKKTACLLPLILFLSLGYLAIQFWAVPKFPPAHVAEFFDFPPQNICGTVKGRPILYSHRVRFTLELEAKEQGAIGPSRGNLQVSVWGKSPPLSDGDRVAFVGSIREFRNFNNPGGFDYRRYMHFQNVWGSVNIQAKNLELLDRRPASDLQSHVQKARNRISELIEKTGKGEHTGVLKALIIGERSEIPKEIKNAFNRTGVSHLLAISGLHVGIVAAAAFALFKWLLQWFPPLLWRAWTRKGAALLTLAPVLIYGLLAGMSPSTQRAVIMISVFLFTFLLETEHDLINTLAIAALLILIIDPPALFSISFQLSFMAVFFIVCGLVENPEGPVKPGILQRLFAFILVSFWATMGTLPLIMFYFNQVSLVSLASNLVLVPLIGFLVVPISLASGFIYPFSPALALLGLKTGALILNLSLNIIRFLAALPFAAVKTVTPNLIEIACFYGLAGVLFFKLRQRFQNRTGSVAGWWMSIFRPTQGNEKREPAFQEQTNEVDGDNFRWRCFFKRYPVAITAGLLLLILSLDIGYWFYQRFWHPDLRVTVVDVGQGSAALLELPRGYNMLIDGGGFSDNESFDVGAQIVAPLLWQKKIKTVEVLVLSHPNSDHFNGLRFIAEHFNTRELWSNGQSTETKSYRDFIETIHKRNIRMPAFENLSRSREINGVSLNILNPPPGFLEKAIKDKWRNLNNNSLVLQARFGQKAILFPGDIMVPAEAELVSTQGTSLDANVLIAPHHGSKSSSSDVFLEAVSPEVVIVSCGWKNRFHFPHEVVLEKYHSLGLDVYRTDMDGAVFITTDGKKLKIQSFLNNSGYDRQLLTVSK